MRKELESEIGSRLEDTISFTSVILHLFLFLIYLYVISFTWRRQMTALSLLIIFGVLYKRTRLGFLSHFVICLLLVERLPRRVVEYFQSLRLSSRAGDVFFVYCLFYAARGDVTTPLSSIIFSRIFLESTGGKCSRHESCTFSCN